jgi:predicted AAA+ superfamily ATPase
VNELLRPADRTMGGLFATQLRSARRRASALTLLRDVLEDPVGRAFLELLACLDRPDEGDRTALVRAYARLFALLAAEAAPALEGADAWQSHLVWRLLSNRNPFSLQAERVGPDDLPPSLLDQARRDLRGLQWLYAFSAEALHDATATLLDHDLADSLARWQQLAAPAPAVTPRQRMARRLALALEWGTVAEELAAHWHRHGLGLLAEHLAARWSAPESQLVGVTHPDPIHLSDLFAYEQERAPLLRNTERFVSGLPAHHALIYGERGTGKSSTVKALLPAFGDRGLRLVEVARDDLGALPAVLEILRPLPHRCILFIDDLSFEEHEIQYKALKAALEGTLSSWPSNVVLYVTTNRRHLVKERFADRRPETQDEVRPGDTFEEKLSLADRFGLHVTFPSPDKERYVAIALAVARARGVTLPEGELRRRAIQWALWQNGRTCRSARQFVDDLMGELA